MKREFLKQLELSDEQIDLIMSEHGKSINTLQSNLSAAEEKVKAYETDLSSANKLIDDFKKKSTDSEELQQQIEKYKADLEEVQAQREVDRKTAFIELGLTKANVHNNKAVMALLDTDKIVAGEKGYTGLDEQLKALQESDSYLFKSEEVQTTAPKITQGGNPTGANSNEQNAFDAVLAKY